MPKFRSTQVPKFASYRSEPVKLALSESSHITLKKNKRHHNETEEIFTQKICCHTPSKHSISSQGSNLFQSHKSDNSGETFVIDKKGDEKNLIYGSLHKYNVPRYHRYGAGRVLGAPTNLRIHQELGDDKCVILTCVGSDKKFPRDKYIFSKILRQRPRILKTRGQLPTKDKFLNELDFIAFQDSSHHQCRIAADERDVREIQNDKCYMSSFLITENESTQDLENESNSQSDSSDSTSGQNIISNASFRKKNAILSRRAEEHPDDIEAWLSLINHQDSLIQKNDDTHRITQAMIKSIADIKIHMYEKALNHMNSPVNQERLLIGLMTEGEKIWEIKTQAIRWEKISKDNINSHVLWTKFVNFKQSTLSIFRYEEVKNVYIQRIRFLSQSAKKKNVNSDKIHHELLYVLLRATLFIRESGYPELAISVWQGILEINFCKPKENLTHDEYFSLFREFWESEAPRLGEDSSKGWGCFLSTQSKFDHSERSVDRVVNSLDKNNLFESWADAEQLRSRASRLPAKTLDDIVEDDPFRVILFTDIQDFLYILPLESYEIYRFCINAFLVFCRLPQLTDIDNNQIERFDDSFIVQGLLRSELSWLEGTHPVTNQETNENEILQGSLPIVNIVSSPESLFYGIPGVYETPKPYRERFTEDTGPVPYSFIRNSLQQLTKSWNDESLAEYYLSFEHTNEPETIRKISKGILKQNPSSFRLYHAYALIENSRGNRKIAEDIFTTALNMRKNYEHSELDNSVIILWKSWIWICLEEKSCLTALKYILCIMDGIPDLTISISSTTILRAKQHLISKRECCLSRNTLFVLYSECLAILEYLSCKLEKDLSQGTSRDIASAMNIFTSSSELLHERNQTKAEELILQSASRLLLYHCNSGPYRPGLIREYLSNFLQRFPKNSIFLSFYGWNESRLRIDNRFRNILLNTVLLPQNDTLTSRLLSIQYEIKNGTVHSVKAAFEHAVSSIATRCSASLWQFFTLYCLRIKILRCQAKSVWYRSLRACPWVKDLYIFGLKKFGSLVDFKELEGTWKIMEEKELRVHVDLEDEFEEYETSRK